nr:MFS transporter [Clostridia bacterium]
IVFYTVLSMAVWLFYTFYTIPYYAVVAELTDDYDERTRIRSSSSLVNALAVGLGNALPALVPTVAVLLGSRFRSESYAAVAAIMSVLGIAAGLVCTRSLKRVYKPKTVAAGENMSLRETVRTFGGILRMRPARLFLCFVFFFLAGSSMIQSNITYAVIDCIGTDYDTGIIIFIVCMVLSMAVTVPIVEKTAVKTDRRTACIAFLTVAVAGELLLKLFGLDARVGSFPVMNVAMPVVLGIGIGTFWTLFYSMSYDLVEVFEYRTGKRSEGALTAFPQLVQKTGSAVGILLAGNLLTMYGYDSSADRAGQESLFRVVTDGKILDGMENISTLFPAVLIAISILFLVLYPVTKKRFSALKTAIEQKKSGETPDESEIKPLLK